MLQPPWKRVWRFLRKLKIELAEVPAISLLGIYPKKTKILISKDICTPMFVAMLFTIAFSYCSWGSLEGLMLKLKLQYFGHLMQRVDS